MSESHSSSSSSSRPVGERLLIATLVLALGDIAGKILALLITMIRTHNLSAEAFGGFGFIISTIGMYSNFAGMALGLAGTRYIAMYRHTEPEKARSIAQFVLLISWVSTGLAAFLLWWATPALVGDLTELQSPMRWAAVLLLFQSLSSVSLGLLAGIERFTRITLVSFLQNVLMLVLTYFWTASAGLSGTIWAMVVSFLWTYLASLWFCRSLLKRPWLTLQSMREHLPMLIHFCLPSIFGGVLMGIAYWWATRIITVSSQNEMLLLSGFLTPGVSWPVLFGHSHGYYEGLRQVGYFTAANQFQPMLALLSNLIIQPMLPMLTSMIQTTKSKESTPEQKEKANYDIQRMLERGTQLASCMLLPTFTVLAFGGPYLMRLFGKSFYSEWDVFLPVLVWGASSAIGAFLGSTLIAKGTIYTLAIFQVQYCLVLIASIYLLQKFGGIGLAASHLIAQMVTLCTSMYFLSRLRLFSPKTFQFIGVTVLLLILLALLSYFTPNALRIPSIFLMPLLVLLGLMLFSKEEVKMVTAVLKRKLLRRG